MGSVSEHGKCPNCISEECNTEYYYKSGEEITSCPDCGYFNSRFIKRDAQGNYVKDEKGVYIYDHNELKNPFAAYCVKGKESIAYQCGSFENEEEFKEFESDMKKNSDVEFACQFINGEIKRTAIVGDLKQRFVD